jgi:superfamily II DNA or RNA helicase
MTPIPNSIPSIHEKIKDLTERIQKLDKEKEILVGELQEVQHTLEDKKPIEESIISTFSPNEKLSIFMSLFRGREDVFPKRWENKKTGKAGYSPACQNEWVRGICKKPQMKCSECPNQAFIPVTEQVIRNHLSQPNCIMGVYPMLKDETCWFLAVDFDKEHWKRDARAFLETCRLRTVPASLERSRSGNGGHVWIFFSEPIAASVARRMGATLLTETMERCPEIGFESYDRFFPNQDTMPSGGFGNLIALPLQKEPRDSGNSLFLDERFEPYVDQWTYLSSIQKMTPVKVMAIAEEAASKGCILGVRMPLEEDEEKPWEMKPSRRKPELPIDQKLPETIKIVLSNQLFVDKKDIPPALKNRLIRLAAFQNPDFYMAQRMRLSTFGKPRIIACAEDFPEYIGLPRGCMDELIDLLQSLNIKAEIEDKRYKGTAIKTTFLGKLNTEQKSAVKELRNYETGVLSATTAFGKTVVAANIIATRKTNTLILVHRRQLLDQWIERLKTFLSIPSEQIGSIGGGKRKPTGIIDVALIQSLVKKDVVDDCVANYGQLIVDECHHLSAVSFEAVARAVKAKYVLGLTATATRKDGHHPIIFMQCGPIRYKVNAKQQARLRPFDHKVIIRNTSFQLRLLGDQKPTIQQIYADIAEDKSRNEMIFDDVLKALEVGRSPLLLTERKEHATMLGDLFAKFCKHVVVMLGGQSTKQRKLLKDQLDAIPENEERLIIATGRYIGEGFDDSRLDTLFLTMPISWHGTLAQYAGRLNRLHHSKKEVIIYDYVDPLLPMLSKMADKRMKGYRALGYSLG